VYEITCVTLVVLIASFHGVAAVIGDSVKMFPEVPEKTTDPFAAMVWVTPLWNETVRAVDAMMSRPNHVVLPEIDWLPDESK